MDRRYFLNSLAAGAFSASGLAPTQAQSKLTIPIATWGSPSHINIVQFIQPLEAFLKERTDGRITVQHYPAGQLASDRDVPVAIPTGRIKVAWSTLALWSGLVPDVGIADAPTGLTMEQLAKATDGENGIKAVLDRAFQSKASKLLAVTDLGPTVIVSSKPIVAPSDLKSLRIRVYSEGSAALFKELGAAPLQIPFGDVYTSLQRGTIDAALIGFQGVQSQRMYEIAKYLLIPASFVGTGLQGYVANLQWWRSIPDGDRKLVAEGVAKAEAHCRAEIIRDRGNLESDYRSKGMTIVSLDSGMPEYKAWADAVAPLLAQAEQKLSKDILAPVYQQMKR